MRRGRRRLGARAAVLAATFVTALAAAGAAGPALPAAAAAPVRTAWWNTAPAGFFPAQTSSGQLAVSEGATGPMALAALAYPPGSAPTTGAVLTLAIDGNSSFGPAQVEACPVKPASTGWKAGAGQTGTPPAYDCTHAAAGQVASSGSSVAFTLGAAQAEPDGSFNLVVLPASGALPFQLVVNPPGTSSLAAKPAPAGASAPASAPAGGTQPAPAPSGSPGGASSPSPGGSSGGTSGSSGLGVPLTPTGAGSGLAALPAPATPSAASPAQAAPGTGSPSTASSGGSSRALAPLPGTAPAGKSSPTGKILGFAALVILLVLYAEGFGVLGGRTRPLSSRFGRRQAGAGAGSVSA